MSRSLARSNSDGAWLPKLKDYTLTQRLGSGTYATVYGAVKKSGPRETVAVKCVLKSSLNKVSTENLLTEIELLKLLKHQHIVELRDIEWDSDYIYLIMDFCSGGDLMSFLKQKRALHEQTVQRFLRQIACALQYMQEKNVAHLDLKPQNILMTSASPPCLKIGDFGFAHYVMGDVQTHYLKGSPLYMAPEIACKKVYDAKADLWSVGVILYECLFGQAPYASPSLKELIDKLKHGAEISIPPPGFTVSEQCHDLLTRLLERDPANRISFQDFFNHPFIELNRCPNENSLKNAREIVIEAVKADTDGNKLEAVRLYVKSLDFFLGAIHYEKKEHTKAALRSKMEEYMGRVELLQDRAKSAVTEYDTESTDYWKELVELSKDHGQLPILLNSQITAKEMEKEEKFEQSLTRQQRIIQQMLTIVHEQQEPKSRLCVLLHQHITVSLTHAERLSEYISAINHTKKRKKSSTFQSVKDTCHIQ